MTQEFNYLYAGTLTGTVNDVEAAQKYLTEDDMTQYVHSYVPSVIHVRWDLKDDGHTYEVHAISSKELDETEIDQLTSWVQGQNSDGLGEGFEQQAFADLTEEREVYPWDEDEPDYGDDSTMVSFDWRTNETKFTLIGGTSKNPCYHVTTANGGVYGVAAASGFHAMRLTNDRLRGEESNDFPLRYELVGDWDAEFGTVLRY